jgi:hypothetical protein
MIVKIFGLSRRHIGVVKALYKYKHVQNHGIYGCYDKHIL